MQLNQYLQQTQRFLRDAKQEFLNPNDLVEYINRARREVAERTQCVRRLTLSSGAIISAQITDVGSGYTAPTLAISTPDFPSGTLPYPNGNQATGLLEVENGTLSSASITYGGDGYFQPIGTITDSTGSGGSIAFTLSPINTLNLGQEKYSFSDIGVQAFPGVEAVYGIQGLAVIYSNYMYSLSVYSWSEYQAKIRQYPAGLYQYVPAFASQYGQGTDGSFYVYPLPSQTYQWQFDCFCIPQDLLTDLSVDVIPQPWADIVPWYAAHLAYLELQNFNAAEYYLKKFDEMCLRKSQYARIGRAINKYGRYVIPFILAAIEMLRGFAEQFA